jgi:serine/threonine-protein kinase
MLCMPSESSTTVKLLDFGCSKNLEREQKLTVKGVRLGSADYMSPEQCSADEVDRRSDIYSLGCMMYQSLTGKRPFQGSIVEVMQKHISKKPESMKTVNASVLVPESLEKAIFKAMAKDPKLRQQTIDELWTDIDNALCGNCSNSAESDSEPSKQQLLQGLIKRLGDMF